MLYEAYTAMAQEKTIPVSFRFTPRTKELLEAAARHQRRSLTNTVEVLVETYCEEHGLLSHFPETDVQPTEREKK